MLLKNRILASVLALVASLSFLSSLHATASVTSLPADFQTESPEFWKAFTGTLSNFQKELRGHTKALFTPIVQANDLAKVKFACWLIQNAAVHGDRETSVNSLLTLEALYQQTDNKVVSKQAHKVLCKLARHKNRQIARSARESLQPGKGPEEALEKLKLRAEQAEQKDYKSSRRTQ